MRPAGAGRLDDEPAAWGLAIALTGAIVALDQSVKQVVVANVARGDEVDLFAGIEITNVRNKGVAFGLLSGGEALVTVLTLGALALLVGYFALSSGRRRLWIPVGLLGGGALGNLADRVRAGAVTDFIDLPLWPAFNLADVAIVLGVAALLLALAAPEARGAPAG